jgi:hypothetical protein
MNRSNSLSTDRFLIRTVKVCRVCGKEYVPTGNYQKYCAECKSLANAAQKRVHHVTHREEDNERCRVWGLINVDKVREYHKCRQLMGLGESNVRAKEWTLTHPEGHRKIQGRMKAKRRSLGFVPLNSPFPNSEAHHLDGEHVAYIPQGLHKSVPHNIWTGHNMEQINVLALAWLEATKENP